MLVYRQSDDRKQKGPFPGQVLGSMSSGGRSLWLGLVVAQMGILPLAAPAAGAVVALGAPFAALVANAGVINVPGKAPYARECRAIRHGVIHPVWRGRRAIG